MAMPKMEAGGGDDRSAVRAPTGAPTCNRTCEDVDVTVRSGRVAQHARHPQADHGVDDQDVAHVLVQDEVLKEEPERTQMRRSAF